MQLRGELRFFLANHFVPLTGISFARRLHLCNSSWEFRYHFVRFLLTALASRLPLWQLKFMNSDFFAFGFLFDAQVNVDSPVAWEQRESICIENLLSKVIYTLMSGTIKIPQVETSSFADYYGVPVILDSSAEGKLVFGPVKWDWAFGLLDSGSILITLTDAEKAAALAKGTEDLAFLLSRWIAIMSNVGNSVLFGSPLRTIVCRLHLCNSSCELRFLHLPYCSARVYFICIPVAPAQLKWWAQEAFRLVHLYCIGKPVAHW